jgi:DNA repair exonuclease SbcCD ATPase subunit
MSKIILKNLQFSNMFSYGEANSLDLNKSRITQLTAPNGSGKSSISTIIQEILFNKNVKGIKKTDIINRWSKSKTWDASLSFTADTVEYEVSIKRVGAQTKVQLIEDGKDISEHKVLDTYKKISDIIGSNFEVFSQLTYQSSTDLLDFLKATDTNRKKFLINLFNLEKYIDIGEKIKAKSSELDKEVNITQGELKSIQDFLSNTNIPTKIEEVLVPNTNESVTVRISDITREIANINDTCKKIDKNNMYVQERDGLQFELGIKEPAPFEFMDEYQTLKMDLVILNKEIASLERELANIKINDKCNACGQTIDTTHIVVIKEDLQLKIASNKITQLEALDKARAWSKEIEAIHTQKLSFISNQEKVNRFEQLTQLIDVNTPKEFPNVTELQSELRQLQTIASTNSKEINDAIDHNKRVSAHNAKVDALIEQKNEFTIRQTSVKDDILIKSDQSISLNILKKAFSTSGIVAFKLENLTKELEVTINYYLSLLSDGQFQVEFTLDKEKLNITVINNGISTPIETVSGGEFSRIQTSVLLAIRSLLSKLGGSSINLLFLDEITGVLDDEGKEKLVEVLQKEHDLNVFLISHDFTHPLIDKISIVKNNNISSIQ